MLFPVRGVTKEESRQTLLEAVKAVFDVRNLTGFSQVIIDLIPEPTNKVDPNAVVVKGKIVVEGEVKLEGQLGYVPADLTGEVKERLAAGWKPFLQSCGGKTGRLGAQVGLDESEEVPL